MLEINKIHLGDCYKLIKEIPDNSIDLIYVDIPYLYKNGGTKQSNNTSRIDKNYRAKRKQIQDIIKGIDYSIFDEFIRVLKNINIMIWCSREQLLYIINYFHDKGGGTPFIHVWCKTNPMPTNQAWLSDIEYCVCFISNHKAININNIEHHKKHKFYISPLNYHDKEMYKHPTIKPLNLVKNHIEVMTRQGDLVLDCFSGSGTTCLACKELDRRYIGIELNEKWHKISVDRLNGVLANGQMSIFTDENKI